MKYQSLIRWAGAASLLLACSSARDVDVSGEVRDPDALASDTPLTIAFYEREEPAEGDETATGEIAMVHSVSLEAAGPFEEVVPVEGDSLYAIAFVDRDGDESCTDGEPWGDTEVTIGEDDTVAVSLRVRLAESCPTGTTSE